MNFHLMNHESPFRTAQLLWVKRPDQALSERAIRRDERLQEKLCRVSRAEFQQPETYKVKTL